MFWCSRQKKRVILSDNNDQHTLCQLCQYLARDKSTDKHRFQLWQNYCNIKHLFGSVPFQAMIFMKFQKVHFPCIPSDIFFWDFFSISYGDYFADSLKKFLEFRSFVPSKSPGFSFSMDNLRLQRTNYLSRDDNIYLLGLSS